MWGLSNRGVGEDWWGRTEEQGGGYTDRGVYILEVQVDLLCKHHVHVHCQSLHIRSKSKSKNKGGGGGGGAFLSSCPWALDILVTLLVWICLYCKLLFKESKLLFICITLVVC